MIDPTSSRKRSERPRASRASAVLAVAAVVVARVAGAGEARAACGAATGETVWVERVVRGDEVVLVDGRRLRFAGVEAPRPPLVAGRDEVSEAVAAEHEARAALGDLVEGRETTFDRVRTDRHGRLVGHLYDTETGQWIEEALVAAGHLRVVPVEGERDCVVRLLPSEAEARAGRRGLWATASHAVVPARAEDLLPRVGRFVVSEGRVRSIGRSGGRIWLNFGDDFRRDFAVVMNDKDLDRFRAAGFDALAAKGVRVLVRGVVVQRDGPRMTIESPEDIERVEK